MKRIAYLGIPGAYSEQAARQHFGSTDRPADVPCASFAQIFAHLEANSADYGILPIENSLAGTVAGSYELLTRHESVRIQAEVIVKINHALLALPGSTLADIHSVRSHPQALAQCETRIQAHGWQPITWYNTAGSARDLAADPLPGVAAIASPQAAALYGLDVLLTDMQDEPENYTRFFVLGDDQPAPTDHDKTSLIFTTRHEPGALVACLHAFAGRGLNLTKIESRPQRTTPWEYIFYLDFEGHQDDALFQAAFAELQQVTHLLRVLGSYPAAQQGTANRIGA